MSYLLLWSAIERYVSLRYHLGDKVMEKIKNLAKEPAFKKSLEKVVSENRQVFRADRPRVRVRLDPDNPTKSLEYYYQVRSNITHRGKAAIRDFEIMQMSLMELHEIFKNVLRAAFSE
jgi:hypothetical protein